MASPELDAALGEEWDAIVIGTGVGGSTLGYRLAQAGWRVLFCERGRSHLNGAVAESGAYPEEQLGGSGNPTTPRATGLFRAAGRSIDRIADTAANGRTTTFVPFVGSGTGGSSALYGMAMERFFPSDFAPRAAHPQAHDAALDDAWPLGYDELAPYYGMAEALFRVRGSADPLRADPPGSLRLLEPQALTPGGAELFDFLSGRGLHPYRLPMACEFVPGCRGCQGYLCPSACKNDAARICLAPALREHGARLLDDCRVVRLEADRQRVTGVVCVREGRRFTLRARHVVLAAGALQTPRLLLTSTSPDWPDGLANRSGLVGRHLMRHYVDLYSIEPARSVDGDPENRFKELAFNDFYAADGMKLGSVQSFGRLPPAEMLYASLRQDLRDGGLPWLAPLLGVARPVLMALLGRMVARSFVLATTLEDLPYADNRVVPAAGAPDASGDAADLRLEYRIRRYDVQRIASLRDAMRRVLAGRRWRLIKQAENNQRIAHVCGTCRFGSDPRTSVLDRDNRAHGIENLHIVDSSFFPTSGGTNPSLTIAANALRVADRLAIR
ncbi:MAG: GMC family oxidoreductase [Proteobacteria bacterium]|nr:GMC family oxidoreductase [Pseudomonadota bacterium]